MTLEFTPSVVCAAKIEPVSGKGKVYLVGAGPGDPELLTLKAYRLMQEVDVLVYDRLVSDEVLDMVPAAVKRIFVGKSPGNHCVPQREINQLIVDLANAGNCVLRLKGGDPYVFGRGGEEAEVLVDAEVPFEVVPGVTSAAGASSSAGIPLTHRDYAQSVTFATGHLKNDTLDLDWPLLARAHSTVVIYMGIGSLPTIAAQLQKHGRAANTPVAIVQNATRFDQRVLVGTLQDIAAAARREGIEAPASIIIGEVVALQARLGNPDKTLAELLNGARLSAVAR
jgi:uroporphyrin-III C-methyltransferase